MKIIIAPDSFKGSLSAQEVAMAIEKGLSFALPSAQYIRAPMADGGEGTLDCLIAHNSLELHTTLVTNPIGEKIKATFGILKNKTAIIEMAKASGLNLVPPAKRDPLKTTSYGTGELIRCALDKGCRRFIIGLGGSATCEGGIGALAALGARFKNASDKEIEYTAEGLEELTKIELSDFDPRLSQSEFIIAHDVDNLLLGSKGALMYAPQKGATLKQLKILDNALKNYCTLVTTLTQKSIANIKGGGAAGGAAAGLYAFLNAKLEPGASVIIQSIGLLEKIKDANLVITGEGQIDSQSVFGKTPIAVAKLAKKFNIPVIGIAARLGKGYHEVYQHGIDAVFSIVNAPMSHKRCLSLSKTLLCGTADNIARLFILKGKDQI